ncbi:MAG: leucine-rich repeat domain-containing protein [Bacteroidaceae bacterium]|nr:leucine-rich repeat domain-containing protein [Bacteroidaceae bacterium]
MKKSVPHPRFLKRMMLLLILLVCGMNAYAYCNDYGYVVINGVKYHLFYRTWTTLFETQSDREAYVEEFTGTSTEIVIPATITDGGQTYNVKGLRYNPMTEQKTATLSSNYVQTIRVENKFSFYPDDSNPTFNCPNLKTIYFEGASPWFSGLYTSYFASPATKNITVYLSDKTEQEISDMTTNAAVWSDFLRVLPMSNINVKRNVNLSISHARLQVGDNYYVNDKSLQVDMNSDLTFKVYKGYDTYLVESVKLNGMDILGEMAFTQGATDALSYYTYTLSNVASDAYITVTGVNTKYEVNVICNNGGTITSPHANTSVITPNSRASIRWFKADGDTYMTIIPNEGYTLDKLYYNSYDNTYRATANADGTFTYPLSADADISVVFKEIDPTINWNVTLMGNVSVTAQFMDKRGAWASFNDIVDGTNTVIDNAQRMNMTILPPENATGTLVVLADGVDLSSYFTSSWSWDYERECYSTEDAQESIPVEYLKATDWVIGVKASNSDAFIWTLKATGDMGASTAQMTVNSGNQTWDVSDDERTATNVVPGITRINHSITVQLAAHYSFTASFKGTDYTDSFVRGTAADGKVPYTCTLALGEPENAGMLVDGTWTIAFAEKPAESIIEFTDTVVRRICLNAGWDTDGDGEISKVEAAAVTTLKVGSNSVFYGNNTITSFDEFQYFTGLTSLESSAFLGCKKLKSVVVPKNVGTIYSSAFRGCNALTSVILPEKLRIIHAYSFLGCTSLTEIALPESVTGIYDAAFESSGVKHLVLHRNQNALSGYGLQSASCLQSITIDDDNPNLSSAGGCNAVLSKNGKIFYAGCKNSFIPEGVETIGAYAFYGHTGLKSITIPCSVDSIAKSAFYGTSALDSIVSKVKVPFAFGDNAFYGISTTCKLFVPAGTRDAYIAAGWTEDVFKGGVFEAAPEFSFDVNGDGLINVSDVTALVNKILHP